MKIFAQLDLVTDDYRHGVVLLGNFDGVHRGHQAVIASARAVANSVRKPLIVLTFEPHPRQVLAAMRGEKNYSPFRLTNSQTKRTALAQYCVDAVLELAFSEAFAALDAGQFIEQVLVQGLAASHVVIGDDFRFGKQRLGDRHSLAASIRFRTHAVPLFLIDSQEKTVQPYSSSRIRDALREGRLTAANEMIGRPWQVMGTVIKGEQIGRTLGVATANIELGEFLPPRHGVYVVRVLLDNHRFDGVASFGVRPTIGDALQPLLEVHIFNFSSDIYGKIIIVEFLHFLRDEMKFSSLDEMKLQIAADATKARKLLDGVTQ